MKKQADTGTRACVVAAGFEQGVGALRRLVQRLDPSASLCSGFGPQPAKFAEFRRLYLEEPLDNAAIGNGQREVVAPLVTTPLCAASDITRKHAVVLRFLDSASK